MRFFIILIFAFFANYAYSEPLSPQEANDVSARLHLELTNCIKESLDFNGGATGVVYSELARDCNAKLESSPELLRLFGGSTGEMAQAASIMGQLWDKQLERIYPKALRCLNDFPEMRAALEKSQGAWLAFRAAQKEWVGAGGGTITYIHVPLDYQWITAMRVMELADEAKGECK